MTRALELQLLRAALTNPSFVDLRGLHVENWILPNRGIANSAGGWTVTGATQIAGAGGDFMKTSPAQADYGTPDHFLFNAAGELISNTQPFGDQMTMEMLAFAMGRVTPFQRLVLTIWAKWDEVSNDEPATGFGFIEDGGAAAVANDHMAALTCDTSNLVLRSGAAEVIVGAADTDIHKWELTLNRVTAEATLKEDGVARVAAGSGLAIQANEWPAKFGAGVLASTGANFFKIFGAHIAYR